VSTLTLPDRRSRTLRVPSPLVASSARRPSACAKPLTKSPCCACCASGLAALLRVSNSLTAPSSAPAPRQASKGYAAYAMPVLRCQGKAGLRVRTGYTSGVENNFGARFEITWQKRAAAARSVRLRWDGRDRQHLSGGWRLLNSSSSCCICNLILGLLSLQEIKRIRPPHGTL